VSISTDVPTERHIAVDILLVVENQVVERSVEAEIIVTVQEEDMGVGASSKDR